MAQNRQEAAKALPDRHVRNFYVWMTVDFDQRLRENVELRWHRNEDAV
jgi:hypothetical protein